MKPSYNRTGREKRQKIQERDTMKEKTARNRLRMSGVKYIVRIHLSLGLMSVIFFCLAGRIDMPRAWIFFIVSFVYYPLSAIFVYARNPELINVRGGKKMVPNHGIQF